MGKASSTAAVMKRKKKGRPSKNSPCVSTLSKPIICYTTRRSRRNPSNCNYPGELEVEDDDERKEKKVKLVERLPQSNQNWKQQKLQNDDCSDSGASGSNQDSEDRKGKGTNDVDCGSEDVVSVQETEFITDTGASEHGQPLESGPTTTNTPLPDKKLLVFILDRLQKKDTRGVFSEPVDPNELPDYLELIQQPMDFGTIRKKLNGGVYRYLEQFEADVFLISSNAMEYNATDTVYYRQARAIRELAKRDFENLRREGDNGEPQPRVVRRGRPPGNRNPKVNVITSHVDRGGQELSLGATNTEVEDKANGSNTYNLRKVPASYRFQSSDLNVSSYRLRTGESYSESTANWNDEFPASILRADMKYGKKQLTVDDNRRDTYCPLSNKSSTLFVGDMKQLVPVGLQDPFSYARSMARFAANLGPVAWQVASNKIETALPPGVQFGPGWVDETGGVTSQALNLSCEKQKFSNSSGGIHNSRMPATPSTSGLTAAAAAYSPSERMEEAVRKLNSQNEAYSWRTPFPVHPKSAYHHQPHKNGFGGMYGYDAPGQYHPTMMDGVQFPSSASDHVIPDEANMRSNGSMTLQPGLQGTEPWDLLESSWQPMPLQQQYALAPELKGRFQALSQSSSSLQIGSSLKPDLALQL